jgi:GT2 family glycosyltransferase
MSIHNIAVLMTSFNRRELTLRSLGSLNKQNNPSDIQLTVFLVDDGCTDGTAEAVRSKFPGVKILKGDGSLFWNGGMRKAFDAATQECFDAYLFLNDDTILYEDALMGVVTCARSWIAVGAPAIVVGSTRSPITGRHSYGGILRRHRGMEFRLEKVMPHPSSSTPCDTMNGNFALIPQQVAAVIGNVEKRFRHQFGDLDYGLRAKRAGFDVVVAPGYVGECHPNSPAGSWRDPRMPFSRRWASLISPKGVPFAEWFLFTRRHYGWRWPYYSVSPYLKTIASSLFSRNNVDAPGDAATPKP